MADDAVRSVRTGENAFASGADAEVLGRHLRGLAKELRAEPEGPLFFGRLDFATDAASGAGDHSGQSYHIGRRRITEDPLKPPLVIDWRAPVSRAFYQASPRDPQGVAVRRRFGWAPFATGEPADLTGIEDEPLSLPGTGTSVGAGTGTGVGPVPGAVVVREIERPRLGPMRDIAATIQPEQDDLVRSEPTRSLCVQGAPGTGKTAVGLHRAAYLLYAHPQRVRRGGLLVLGPGRAFLAYIAEVLPALGESGVRQSTIDEEIAAHETRAQDGPAAEAVKHDARMAGVLHRALYARVAPPAEELTVPDGSYRWRVPRDELAGIVAEVRAEAPPYAVGRERVRGRAVRALRRRAERRAGPRGETWARRIGRARPVAAFVDAVWPGARPEEVLAGLLTDPADTALTPAEREAIRWARPPRSPRSARWSAADLLLLDELAGLIERPEGFAHVVVDEAQDLSPMQCRAIARRVGGSGSLTVLGDLAQGTTPWAARTWPGQLAHLGRPDAAVIPLTTGFRVPATIVDFAGRLLPALGVEVPPARSLRAGGELTVRRVDDLAAATVAAVRAALSREGSIGVVADGPGTGALRTALTGAGVETAVAGTPEAAGAAAARVTVVPAALAKGLEYEHVVVVEPAAIVGAEPRGTHRLYVALTRAVSRLDVLHRLPLPAELAGPAL
nr:AAA family ATPase [Streptomyces inusitatus]